MSVLGVLIVLTLTAINVARHPSAIQGTGNRIFRQDLALLLIYAVAGIWVRYRSSAPLTAAIRLGAMTGLLLGSILAANHVIELFVPVRNFALVISPVFLALALLAATGSAAMERTESLLAAVIAGVWCAIVGTLVLLCAGYAIALAAEARVELWLQQAFVESGMSDPGGFVVRNTLEAASEGLVRMPVVALFLSLLGGSMSVWISNRSRIVVFLVGCFALLMFVWGASALWHANSLPRAARPPFVLAGIFLASVALSAAHPIWSSLRLVVKASQARTG